MEHHITFILKMSGKTFLAYPILIPSHFKHFRFLCAWMFPFSSTGDLTNSLASSNLRYIPPLAILRGGEKAPRIWGGNGRLIGGHVGGPGTTVVGVVLPWGVKGGGVGGRGVCGVGRGGGWGVQHEVGVQGVVPPHPRAHSDVRRVDAPFQGGGGGTPGEVGVGGARVPPLVLLKEVGRPPGLLGGEGAHLGWRYGLFSLKKNYFTIRNTFTFYKFNNKV